ncbi:hypothetical protein PN471_02495 [Aphanizomenon sp. CS-733/32]|uniref:hypothetical protein n=1 Tax=Aphanizomenon sp. CS-733/32 TaxID=3021715 RepID=UPI00232CEB8B|nr:hypothetical protein [Aphanizomenon sp. CS-733/32]MDB9307536.1 hypothetical protein [Aphanizomenon sp. CS-733/32]
MSHLEKITITSSKLEINLINIIFISCLFPFFKVIPYITAEVQPIASIFAAIYIWFFPLKRKYRFMHKIVLIYCTVILFYFVSAILQSQYELVNFLDSLQSLIILISPLLIFIVLLEKLELVSVRLFRLAYYAWFIISFFQLHLSGILNFTGISLLLTILIPRFSAEQLVDWDRGVVAFAPEPSYGAHVILLLFAFSFFLYRRKLIKNTEFSVLAFLFLFMVYANQSITMGGIISVFFVTYTILELFIGTNYSKCWMFLILLLLLFLFTFILAFANTNLQEIRVFDALSGVISKGIDNNFFVELGTSYGSTREIGVNTGYYNVLITHGMGSGLGGWGTYSLDSLASNPNIPPTMVNLQNTLGNFKPYAYASLVAFDLGLPGLISLSSIFIGMILVKLNDYKKISSYSLSCLATFFLGLYFNSPTSLPIYWIFFILFMKDGKE